MLSLSAGEFAADLKLIKNSKNWPKLFAQLTVLGVVWGLKVDVDAKSTKFPPKVDRESCKTLCTEVGHCLHSDSMMEI